MFAGSLIFETPIDTSGVEDGSKEIKGEFGGLKKVAAETGKAINDAFSGDFSKPIASAQAKINDLLRQFETVSSSLKDAIAADDDSAAEKYGKQQIRIYDQLEAAREKLSIAIQESSHKQAEAEKKAAAKAEQEQRKSFSNMRKAFGKMEKTANRFGTRLRSVISGALVFNLISSGLREFTSYFNSALKGNKEFTTQLAKLKGALLTAFQPIYTYVIPIIIKLMQYLTAAAKVVANFFSILTGKSIQESANAAENLYNEANAIGAVGSAAKKANKALAGFDELNVLPSANEAGSGGGSGSVMPDFSDFENSSLSTELETIMSKLNSIGEYIPVIATALVGLKLGGFIADLLTANKQAKNLKETIALLGKKAGITLGVTLAITGITLETKGIISTFQEGLNGINFVEILGGGGMLAGAGALIGQFFGKAILGGAIGGITAGIPAFITGVYDAVVGGFDWLNAALVAGGATAAGAGIGAMIGSIGGPIGALLGLIVGLAADIMILSVDLGKFIAQNWEAISAWFSETLSKIGQWFVDLWQGIVDVWGDCSEWFDNEIIQPVTQFFSDLWDGLSQGATDAWNGIKHCFEVVANWFDNTVIQPVSKFFTDLWDGFSNAGSDAWDAVKDVFSSVGQFFTETFEAAWSGIVTVFSVAGEIFVDIKDGIVSAFKLVVNGIIDGLNKVVKIPFQGLNTVLDKIHNLKILDLQPFSFLTWRAPVPEIPKLAQGAVIPPNREFLAVLGDQKHGTNIEAPLSTIQEAVANVMQEFMASNMAGHEATVAVLRELLEAVLGITIGDDVIANAVDRYNRKMAVVRGG